jgi:hypothetical protein
MDITATISKEVVGRCQKNGFVIPPQLATYYLRAILSGSTKDQTGSVEITTDGVQAVVERAVSELCRTDSPVLETFRMHAALIGRRQDIVNAQRTESVHHRAKSQSLLSEICNKTDKHLKVFGDIVLYILHETGLYNAANKDIVQKETMTALESVIPRTSIESFVAQTDTEKLKQLDELWRIVWGIRLFNRENHKGGAGVQDVPGELQTLISLTNASIQQLCDQIQTVCKDFETVLSMEGKLEIDSSQRGKLIEEYVNRRLYQWWLNIFREQLNIATTEADELRPELESCIVDITTMVTSSVSVPKSQIYPKFIDVSDKWEQTKKTLSAVKDIKRLVDLLLAYQSSYTVSLKASMIEEATKNIAKIEAPPANRSLIEQEVNVARQGCGCYFFETPPHSAKIAYGGFCLGSLANEGFLKSARDDVGCIRYQDRIYRFSSERYLLEFVDKPARFTAIVDTDPSPTTMALLPLLGIDTLLLPHEVYLFGTRQRPTVVALKPKMDADTQTGQIKPYKDYKYQWNEWELRRLALKLADLRNKRTHSCQTQLSHFKRNMETQCYPQRQTGTQTLIDKSVQPALTTQYIAGLRGEAESRLRVVRMTFDE